METETETETKPVKVKRWRLFFASCLATSSMLLLSWSYATWAANRPRPEHDGPIVTLSELSDEELAVALAGAERRWRKACGSIMDIDAPYQTDEQLMKIYSYYRDLRKERDARQAKRD